MSVAELRTNEMMVHRGDAFSGPGYWPVGRWVFVMLARLPRRQLFKQLALDRTFGRRECRRADRTNIQVLTTGYGRRLHKLPQALAWKKC
jgi:hypothetical protein